MAARIKKHENLTETNIQHVINLLNDTKPITKKEACSILNISYNTTRLNKIIEDHLDTVAYRERRKAQNKGKGATEMEIKQVVNFYLDGSNISDIAKHLYRSPAFIKAIINRIGVPQKLAMTDFEGRRNAMLPEQCVSDEFEEGERVWAVRQNYPAVVKRELRPEKADGYDFDLGDGEQSPDVADFKNVAHQLGLTNDQAKTMLGIYNQISENDLAEEQEQFEQMNVEYLQEIQQEWGDDFNKNAELARRGFNSFASEGAVEVLRETGLANHPEILKTFARIGQAFSEDNVLPGTRGAIGGMSPVHAEETIASRMADPEFRTAYLDGSSPHHEAAVREMERLHNALA